MYVNFPMSHAVSLFYYKVVPSYPQCCFLQFQFSYLQSAMLWQAADLLVDLWAEGQW